MRFVLILLLTALPLLGQAVTFQPWPAELPTYSFSRTDVATQWQLTGDKRGPFPTAATLKDEAARYPALMQLTEKTVQANRNHPRLKDMAFDWSDQDYAIAAAIIADAWVALFNGDFAKAWELGQLVGPPGYFPALYALALHAQYLEPDPEQRIAQLERVITETRALLQQAAGPSVSAIWSCLCQITATGNHGHAGGPQHRLSRGNSCCSGKIRWQGSPRRYW